MKKVGNVIYLKEGEKHPNATKISKLNRGKLYRQNVNESFRGVTSWGKAANASRNIKHKAY